METNFNFKSQIATSRSQSERLLTLGLKKETADMTIEPDLESTYEVYYISAYPPSKRGIPAWSLHRIISMVYSSRAKKNGLGLAIIEYENPFEDMIRQIEWLIKEGYFNKEYLV